MTGKKPQEPQAEMKPLATLTPTGLKRSMSFLVLLALGLLLVFLAFIAPPKSLIWQGFLLGLGVGILILAENLRRATRLSLVLWPDRLEDSTGRQICQISDIVSIDRGVFAFKPSNGFLLRTKGRLPGHWAPGLWWQLGRRIGVGGVTPAGQAKFMAEMIALTLSDGKG